MSTNLACESGHLGLGVRLMSNFPFVTGSSPRRVSDCATRADLGGERSKMSAVQFVRPVRPSSKPPQSTSWCSPRYVLWVELALFPYLLLFLFARSGRKMKTTMLKSNGARTRLASISPPVPTTSSITSASSSPWTIWLLCSNLATVGWPLPCRRR